MDPVSAFQVACGAFQLAGMAIKLSRMGYEIYSSGSMTEENKQLGLQSSKLDQTVSIVEGHLSTLRSVGDTLTPVQQRLQDLASDTTAATRRLQSHLDVLKTKSFRKRNILRKLITSVHDAAPIQAAQQDLEQCQKLLDAQLLVTLGAQVTTCDAAQRSVLHQLESSMLEHRQYVDADMQTVTSILKDLQVDSRERERETQQTQETVERIAVSHSDAVKRARYDRLVESLSFKDLDSRYCGITEAHGDTYRWIWPDDTDIRWPHLPTFLRERNQSIYWISGKAGSGKSTLMKFISDSRNLESNLRIWAPQTKIIILSHFFWRNGSPEQSSFVGLLRSIIVRILEQLPEMADRLMPLSQLRPPPWTFSRLIGALKSLTGPDQQNRCTFFLLLDGLDEFSGQPSEQHELIQLLKTLSQQDNFKICLSSRPELPIQDQFQSYPHLTLENFTEKDMYEYVAAKLMTHPRFKANGTESINAIRVSLVKKAEGVFQWLFHSVEYVVEGIKGRETIQMLQRRVQDLPRSLYGLYSFLLSRIQPLHRKQTATLLKFVLSFQSRGGEILSKPDVLCTALALEPECIRLIDQLTATAGDEELQEQSWAYLMEFQRIVFHRSAGLLECSSNEFHNDDALARCHCSTFEFKYNGLFFVPSSGTGNLIAHFQLISVGCHHRSVADFFTEDTTAIRFLDHNCVVDNTMEELWLASISRILKAKFSALNHHLRCGQFRERPHFRPRQRVVGSRGFSGNFVKYETLCGRHTFRVMIAQLLKSGVDLSWSVRFEHLHEIMRTISAELDPVLCSILLAREQTDMTSHAELVWSGFIPSTNALRAIHLDFQQDTCCHDKLFVWYLSQYNYLLREEATARFLWHCIERGGSFSSCLLFTVESNDEKIYIFWNRVFSSVFKCHGQEDETWLKLLRRGLVSYVLSERRLWSLSFRADLSVALPEPRDLDYLGIFDYSAVYMIQSMLKLSGFEIEELVAVLNSYGLENTTQPRQLFQVNRFNSTYAKLDQASLTPRECQELGAGGAHWRIYYMSNIWSESLRVQANLIMAMSKAFDAHSSELTYGHWEVLDEIDHDVEGGSTAMI